MQLIPTSVCGLAFSNSSLLAPAVLQPRFFPRISNADGGVCSSSAQKKLRRVVCRSNNEERTPPTAEASPLVKLAWYGSEAFGNAVAMFRPKSGEDQAADDGEQKFDGPVDREDAVALIKKDFDRSYFVTGNMATGIYENDCEFADPFVSFKGLNRFRQNVGNLGSFMEESSLKLTEWQEYEDRIYARWRFNCVLSLPWRPILAGLCLHWWLI
ncbi:hypothetical protein Mapa_013352 [Marchantia paleacea]|nr:hypothetical protein Mapa_013352 [Marchantia paleacea]